MESDPAPYRRPLLQRRRSLSVALPLFQFHHSSSFPSFVPVSSRIPQLCKVVRMVVGSMATGHLYSSLIPLVLLVDGSSPIDVTDPHWELYLVTQNETDQQGEIQCRLIGFAAIYRFYHYPGGTRLRLSQVDMESLLVTGQVSVFVVGKDILITTGEVGSQCTILTDNYCEDAYDLLQNPVLKKLMLAGILLDTQNLQASASISMTRDAEAVQLLLVGLAPNYRYALFDQCNKNNAGNTEKANENLDEVVALAQELQTKF